MPNLQAAIYPGAFNVHSNEQLAENVKTTVFPEIVRLLTTPIEAEEAWQPGPREVVFTGTVDEVNSFFVDSKWSDGMPVTPPTIDRVEEFMKFTDLAPDEEIAILPVGYLRATPWKIAVNAVTAGCRPEYMPLLIAYVKAIGVPKATTMFFGSTHSWIPYVWINGPLSRQLGIDHGQGLIGHPVNRVIGRTLGLIVANLAGFRIKESAMGSYGYTVPWALAENEDCCLRIGWEPFQVQKGYDLNANILTATTSTMWGNNNIPATSDAEIVMQLIAREMVHKSTFASGSGASQRQVLITPPVAEVLAAGGYTKQSLVEDLRKTARMMAYEYTFSQVYGSFGATYPPFEEQLEKNLTSESAEKGQLPPWYPRFPGWEDIVTIPYAREGATEILICGDESRNKTQTHPGGSVVTMEIELPANWDALMEERGYQPLDSFHL